MSLARPSRVLILDGHSAAAMEVLQSLGRRGLEVDVACQAKDCLAFHSRYVGERLLQPQLVDMEPAKAWLRELCRSRGYALVVPTTDASMMLMRELDPGEPARARAVLPSNEALDVAMDKQAAHVFAQKLFIPVPRSMLYRRGSTVQHCNSYPVVLKPIHSRAVIDGENRRLSAVVVKDVQQQKDVLSAWLPHMAVQQQEFARGHGYGIEMLFDRGEPVWHFAHERIHETPLTGGGSSYRRSIVAPPALLAAAERLLRALKWHGVAMVEFRGDPKRGWCFMEINPRLWGSLALAVDCGVDFPWGLALLARGERPAPQPAYRTHYYTRHVAADITWHHMNLRADRADAALLTRHPLRAALEWLRPLLGRESWDHFDWRDPGVTRLMLRRALHSEGERVLRHARKALDKRRALRRHEALLRAQRAPRRILFLCYGNICRSPIAAEAARKRLAGVQVASAGFHPVEGRATPEHVRRAAAGLGIHLSAHRSRRVTAADLDAAGLILCMDMDNLRALGEMSPAALERATLLGLFSERPVLEIADPYALGEAEARAAVRTLDEAFSGFEAWLGRFGRPAPVRRAA